jgi:hypothetical protein
MKNLLRKLAQRRQAGTVAVEMAVVLPILALLLTAPLFLARYYWHYTVAQKAAHDAALYLSRVSQFDMRMSGAAPEVPAASLARSIASMELAQLNPGSEPPPPSLLCEYQLTPTLTTWNTCNGLLAPISVKANVAMMMTDPIFSNFTWFYSGEGGLLVMADVTMRYVGN